MLTIDKLKVELDAEAGVVKAIDGLALSIRRGETFALVLAANLFADGVRDAFDPRSRALRARLTLRKPKVDGGAAAPSH